MRNELKLAFNFISELIARRYEYARVPEPDLVMENEESVKEFQQAGLVTGNGSSIYLFNLLLLCGAIRPGSVVVDLACGPANLLMELARLNPQARFVGVDMSPAMLRCAEELRAKFAVENVQLLQGDITDLSRIREKSADVVMSTLSLHHLPDRRMLETCFREIARIVRTGGSIHLMDFAALKRISTTEYFVFERTKGLGPFLAQDYHNSLHAAYRIEEFRELLPILSANVPSIQLRKTFGVPFLIALTSVSGDAQLTETQRRALYQYWMQMLPSQVQDFDAMHLFFSLGGLRVTHPRHFEVN